MIHLGLGSSNLYAKLAATNMLSVFENHVTNHLPSITVHFLHEGNFTSENREKISYIAGQYGQLVKFYNVEELCADKLAEIKRLIPRVVTNTRHTVAAFYRMLFPQVVPSDVTKGIFLDSDMIVNMDISKFWQIDLGDKTLAAVPEVSSYVPVNQVHYSCRENLINGEDYFNSGVLMINIPKYRSTEDLIRRGLVFYDENPGCDCMDQDVLCYCFASQAVKLPMKFNVLVEYARMNNDFDTADRICHYITSSRGKGIGLDTTDPYNRLWLKYFIKTPWFNEESLGRFYGEFQKLDEDRKDFAIKISAALSKKNRAFIISENNVDIVKQIFAVRPDEEILVVDYNATLQEIFDAMNADRDKNFFVVIVPNFPFDTFKEVGFVYGEDFIDGMEFLSDKHGMPLNPYPLIQAL